MYPKHKDSKSGPVASPSFPDVEKEVLEHWDKDGTFQESIDQRAASGAEEFVFYDGPPFANGLPHYGHLLTGYTKDLVPRYQTMRGRRVERRFGWDTHGLPAEVEAERLLGISGRPEIEKYGVDKFNGLGAYGGIMLKLVGDAIPKINGLVSDQIGFIGNLATQSVSNPKSVSGVELAGQPIKAAAGAANVAAPFLGASLGRKAIGKAAGGLLGKGISSIAGSGAGATLGTALGGPIVGTVIGAAVGSIVGGLIESTVSSALDFLKSIDEGISDLAGELMPYNSELVAATVEANLKSLESQLNQADYLGPILAENVRAKNDFEIAMREFGTEFTAAFAPYLTSMYELLTPVVEYGTEQVASLNILVALGQDFLRLATTRQIDFQDTWDSIKHYLDIIAGNTKKESEFLQELEDFINPSLNQQALDPSLLNNTGAFGKTSFGPNGVIF